MNNDIRVLRGSIVDPISTLQNQIIQTVTSNGLGNGGGDANYTHYQNVASLNWVVVHNLNKFPSVTIIDSAGSIVIGDVGYVDKNKLLITLSALMSGTATLN